MQHNSEEGRFGVKCTNGFAGLGNLGAAMAGES